MRKPTVAGRSEITTADSMTVITGSMNNGICLWENSEEEIMRFSRFLPAEDGAHVHVASFGRFFHQKNPEKFRFRTIITF